MFSYIFSGFCRYLLQASDFRNRQRNKSRVSGPAANRFQSSAMGKFFSNVPAQIAGSWLTGFPARIRLNKIEATRLIVGYITRTVQQEVQTIFKKRESCSVMILPARRCPSRFPHKFEKRKTKIHM